MMLVGTEWQHKGLSGYIPAMDKKQLGKKYISENKIVWPKEPLIMYWLEMVICGCCIKNGPVVEN